MFAVAHVRAVAVTVLCLGIASCSKGGAPDQNSMCQKLSDPVTDDRPALPNALYAELVGSSSDTPLGLMLDGTGGIYTGMHTFTKCDAVGTYTVQRLVLVSIKGDPVATAVRTTAGSYTVTYAKGGMTVAAGTGFTSVLSYNVAASMPSLKLQALTASGTSAKVGDRININVSMSDDQCGIQESQWWLVPVGSPGGTAVTEVVKLAGGSGQISLRIPPKLSVATYAIEGQVILHGGRVYSIRRNGALTTSHYMLADSGGAAAVDSMLTALNLDISANPAADSLPAAALGMDAMPASVNRCDQVNISLKLADDQALPMSQMVKVWLGTSDAPMLATAMLTGGDTLYGTFVVPSDAPGGVWYGYPDVVHDAAGNESSGTLTNGKFLLKAVDGSSNQPLPVMAATFIVPNNTTGSLADMAMAVPDGGAIPLPDLATPLPATLAGVTVSPNPVMTEGGTATVSVSWTDQAMILK